MRNLSKCKDLWKLLMSLLRRFVRAVCFMWQAVRIRMFLARQSIKKERPGENFPCRPPVCFV